MRNILTALILSSSLVFLGACTHAEHQTTTQTDSASETVQHDATHGSSATMQHNDMEMDLGPADAELDLRFIDAMTLHHQGAIEMAEQAGEKANHAELKTLAQEIITAQQQEIEQMQQWRQQWYANAGTEPVMYHSQMGHSMPMSEEMRSSMMMNPDLGAADAEFDLRFINAMIPHHEGAVTMAQEALEKSNRPEVKQLAQTIIDAQQPEIQQMQQWKQQWYGQQ